MNIPELNEGELYICGIIDADGTVTHTILLPGDSDDAGWQAQMDWAKSVGGDLPNRMEQSLLFAKFRDQFNRDWYWSNEQHASNSDNAWFQGFYYGYQNDDYKSAELRARAVRRVKEKS